MIYDETHRGIRFTVSTAQISYVLAASAALTAVFAPLAIYLYGRKQ